MKYKKNSGQNSALSRMLRNKTVLITGGAGSIGSFLAKRLLEYPVRVVRVLDIDEYSLFRLKRTINDDRLRLLLGSILDNDRVEMACNNVDIIIHAAAVKNIEISEFNPIETINVNINGMVNLIKATIKCKPEKFLNVSTDKAANASTLYGTTKQLSERLTSWAGIHIKGTKCASVRFGNVIETRGNVFEVWNEEVKNDQPLSITDPSMKRYFFHIDEAIDFILKCLLLMNFGEIFIPKMQSYKIKNLAMKISKRHKIIGLRQGEKLQESLISEDERKRAEEGKDIWVIRQYLPKV
jgi:FlaA1/EpsC-like NDP-sugar epimerase